MHERLKAIDGLEIALEIVRDWDFVKVTRCADCEHWEANNAEEGDCSGVCRNRYGVCEGKTTDATWFCEDGEEISDD